MIQKTNSRKDETKAVPFAAGSGTTTQFHAARSPLPHSQPDAQGTQFEIAHLGNRILKLVSVSW